MKLIRSGIFLYICISLSGCLYGQCIEGACSLERERMLSAIKTYGEYWVKPGMTKEIHSQDSIDCGGSTRGPDFTPQEVNAARQPEDKNDFAPRTRLAKVWINCMKEKGYQYVP